MVKGPWMQMIVVAIMVVVMGGAGRGVFGQFSPSTLAPLKNNVVLDQDSMYHMYWTPQENDVVFEVQVATKGYVGLGFSPNGGMNGADILLGWVDDDDGKPFLQDRYGDGYNAPKLDESQDVHLLAGYQNDTHTVLRFSRPWTTCDHSNDYQLSDDTVRVIWAYYDQDPSGDTPSAYHGYQQRGTRSLYLQQPQFSLPLLTEDVKTLSLLAPNVSVPSDMRTLYWCQMYKIPPLPRKTHVIGYVPRIDVKNFQHLHHFVLYECHLPESASHYDKWLGFDGFQCHSANMPTSWRYCANPIIAWAVGGEGEMFPDHVGFPLGEEHGGANYFMLEIHYDNPTEKSGIYDSSGLEVFYTEVLRRYDAGLILVGHDVTLTEIIPPNQKNWLTIGRCDGSCTQEMLWDGVCLPQKGIYLPGVNI